MADNEQATDAELGFPRAYVGMKFNSGDPFMYVCTEDANGRSTMVPIDLKTAEDFYRTFTDLLDVYRRQKGPVYIKVPVRFEP